MASIGPMDFEFREGEMTLRSTGSFKKRNFMEFSDKFDGFDEIASEESKFAKRRKVGIVKLPTSLFSFKCLVLENCRLEGWEASYPATIKRCSVSEYEKSKSAVSKWARAGIMAAKVGKGLSKDDKAQKLDLRHWLEAIDTQHRYGHNLQFYHEVWLRSKSSRPFFYWLDIGDGREENLDQCPRHELQMQCIRYLGPKEREAYEVIIDNGKLVYRQRKEIVHTPEGSKWIFVLSSSKTLYIGEKKKGTFHHSSFLAGGATIASGRMVAYNGVLDAIWPYSGHYCPTEKHFMEFINFLEEHNVDLTNVKKYAIDDDIPPPKPVDEGDEGQFGNQIMEVSQVKERKPLSRKWTFRAGPKIDCETNYLKILQFLQARGHLNLSPRVLRLTLAEFATKEPIPFPRPSPKCPLFMNNLVYLFLTQ